MNGCRVRIAWSGVIDVLHANANDVAQVNIFILAHIYEAQTRESFKCEKQ